MSFGDFAMGYLVGQSFAGPNMPGDGKTPYEHWSNGAKKEFQKMLDDIGDRAYWEAWDKAFIQGDIEQLRSIPEAGIQTAKALGISKEALIRGIENGEIKTFVVLEPSAMKVIPKLSFWADETREEAQTEEYKEWLKNIKELMQKYEHRIVCAHTIPHTA